MRDKRRQVKRHNKRPSSRSYKRRKSYAPLWALLIVVGLWYLVIGKEILPMSFEASGEKQGVVEESIPYESTCTQANVAKILACTLTTEKVEQGKEEENWYNKYYDILEKELGFTYLSKENALKPVSYAELTGILNEVLGEDYNLSIDTSADNLNKNISLNQFIGAYTGALEKTGKGIQIEYIDLVIVATPADKQSLSAWQVVTNEGNFNFEGLILEPLKNKTVRAAIRKDEILGVTNIVSSKSILKECYIVAVEDKKATIKLNDSELIYDTQVLSKAQEGTVCNLTLQGNTIIDFKLQLSINGDRLVRLTSDTITLEKAGSFSYDTVTLYDETEIGSYTSLGQLPYGIQVEYTAEGNKLTSLRIVKRNDAETIRVVLSNENKSYLQDQVQLISTEEYDIVYNGQTTVLPKEKSWDSSRFDWEESVNTIRFVPKGESQLKVISMTKNQGNPKYRGILEITKENEGFIVVNELSMEDYVAAVIPSEMPTSYGIEAVKVQAVAARTYANTSKGSSKYIQYGAQIDDTTDSQVYNNIPADEIAYSAAEATRGQVLSSSSNLVSSKFFATSCGYTANYGEVWAAGENFPTNTPSYLVSRQQYLGDPLVENMTDEEEAYNFLTLSSEEVDAFDKDSPWFRWKAQLTGEELANLINPAINKISKAYPNLVKVKNDNNQWEAMNIETVGSIKDLEVLKRGQGGNIMELLITGSENTVKVTTEYLIRSLFSTNPNQNLTITRADTTEVSSMSLLPSAFFVMDTTYDPENNLLQTVTLHGGGFGHGVGMSQDGVRGMANRGYTYREILKHYYPEVELVSMKE